VSTKPELKDPPLNRLDSAATHCGGAGRPFRLKVVPGKQHGFELQPSHVGSYWGPYAKTKYAHDAQWLARASNAVILLKDPEQFILDAIDIISGVATDEQRERMRLQICRDCRSPISESDQQRYGAVPGQCFLCTFWANQLRARNPSTVIVQGRHYEIGQQVHAERPRFDSHLLGFGGQRWEILFKDGRRVVTHNLWSQGDIPERLRALPAWADNAEFIPEAPL
jgi:hypothetical protein